VDSSFLIWLKGLLHYHSSAVSIGIQVKGQVGY